MCANCCELKKRNAELLSYNASLQRQADEGANAKMKLKIALERIETLTSELNMLIERQQRMLFRADYDAGIARLKSTLRLAGAERTTYESQSIIKHRIPNSDKERNT